MPDFFSHCILAELIYNNLSEKHKRKITSHTLYLLGAQGGDVFFTYNFSPASKNNVGKLIHLLDAEKLFKVISCGNESYVCGFATHYAVDSVIHPFVYDFEKKNKKPLSHLSFESDFGVYLSDKFAIPRHILCPQSLSSCIFAVYDTMRRALPFITVNGVEKCLKKYYTAIKYQYKFRRVKIKEKFDFSVLDKDVSRCISLGARAVENVLDGDVERDGIFKYRFLQGKQ